MTRQESILALVKEICRPAESEEALLGLLCAAAEEDWKSRLRPGIGPEDCEDAVRCACAFTAAAGLLRSRGGSGGGPSFTAGSVTVRSGGAGETESAARALQEQAVRLMAPWTGGEDFAFQGVRT